MIDLHCHILPGIDDGAPDLDASVALARAFVRDGTTTVVATPHVSTSFPNDPDTIAAALERVHGALDAAGIELRVLPGAELAVSQLAEIEDPSPFGLGGGPCLLVESPYTPAVRFLEDLLSDLRARGFVPLLAHPERSSLFQEDPGRLGRLVSEGAFCSLTAGSFAGRFGRTVQRFALQLARDGLCHDISSDAHDLQRRPPGLAVAFEGELAPLRDRLTREAPAALLEGRPPPAGAPLGEPPGGVLRRLFRREG